MLILWRKAGEKIRINDDIVITFCEINEYGKIKIGFDAPKDCIIDREEIYHARRKNANIIKYKSIEE